MHDRGAQWELPAPAQGTATAGSRSAKREMPIHLSMPVRQCFLGALALAAGAAAPAAAPVPTGWNVPLIRHPPIVAAPTPTAPPIAHRPTPVPPVAPAPPPILFNPWVSGFATFAPPVRTLDAPPTGDRVLIIRRSAH